MDTHLRVHTLTNFHAHLHCLPRMHRLPCACEFTYKWVCGVCLPASLAPGVQEPRSCFPGLIGAGARVGGLPRSDALSYWTNLLYLFLSEFFSLSTFCLPGLTPLCLFPVYLAFFPQSTLSPTPCLPSLPGPAPCLCPTLSVGAFHSPVRSWSERSRTRFQLRLRGGQLLPGPQATFSSAERRSSR